MPIWETESDWDAPQSEAGAIHEQPTGTDYPASDILAKGYPSDWSDWGSIPTPIAVYPLEDDGSTANEITGNGIDGTITGATPTAGGPFGRPYLDFDGAGDEVTVDTSAVSTYDGGAGSTDPLTVAALINPDTLEGSIARTGEVGSDDPWEFWVESDGALTFRFGENNGRTFTSSRTISTDTWTHVGMGWTSDGNDGNFHIDGVQGSTFGMNTNEETVVGEFNIGTGTPAGDFDGGIAQVIYWSSDVGYKASADEMAEVYGAVV